MKLTRLLIPLLLVFSFSVFYACGGGGGGSASFGEVAIDVTDAKPVLPDGATNLWITFTEVLAHKSGGGWMSLPLPESPYTIDLLQFYDGNTTELVPPVSLSSGKYTQIRIVISEATIRFDNDPTSDTPVEIPSENLKTDKNFDFDVEGGGAVDIIVDFDLSQSIVVTYESGTPSYKLKPVLHIVDASEAATINGKIDQGSFVDSYNAIVTVFLYNPDPNVLAYEEYTKLEVSKSDGEDPTEFSIFWLVPNEGLVPAQDYKVEIDFNSDGTADYESPDPIYLEEGEDFYLNEGNPIL